MQNDQRDDPGGADHVRCQRVQHGHQRHPHHHRRHLPNHVRKPHRWRGPSDHLPLPLQNHSFYLHHPNGDPLQPPGDRQRLPLQEAQGYQQLLPRQPRLRRPLRGLLRHDLQRLPADLWKVSRRIKHEIGRVNGSKLTSCTSRNSHNSCNSPLRLVSCMHLPSLGDQLKHGGILPQNNCFHMQSWKSFKIFLFKKFSFIVLPLLSSLSTKMNNAAVHWSSHISPPIPSKPLTTSKTRFNNIFSEIYLVLS